MSTLSCPELPQLFWGAARSSKNDDQLNPAELEIVKGASTRRKVQFRIGRAAARLALRSCGFSSDQPILTGASGEPLFPESFVGSISHCAVDRARNEWIGCAVVCKAAEAASIGVDIEDLARPLTDGIERLICRPNEMKWIREDQDEVKLRLLQIFSAKEALYKAIFKFEPRYIGFHEVELSWEWESDGFKVVRLPATWRRSDVVLTAVRSELVDGLVRSVVVAHEMQ